MMMTMMMNITCSNTSN